MKALIDTNVVMDFIGGREPYFIDADSIIALCARKTVHGYVAPHSVSTVFYLMRHFIPDSKVRRYMLKDFFRVVDIGIADREGVISALNNEDFGDFEDGLQYECARQVEADCIITRNEKDFIASVIPVCTPQEFLSMFAAPNKE